jgi:hypothetical protein
MRPFHTLHLYQPDDRFATVVTSGSSHRFCGARQIGGIAWLLSYEKIIGIARYCGLQYRSPNPAFTASRRLLATRKPCGSNPRHEGRDEAGAYTASLSARRPLRHRRNLRQSTTD